MGLISYFKDLHYDNKFNRANKLLAEGRGSEAEEVLTSILDKHPMAAGKMAEYYYTKSLKANVKDCIALFKKVVALEKQSGDAYDVQSYRTALSEFGKHLVLRSDWTVEESVSSFDKCWKVSSNSSLAFETLKSVQNDELRNALISHIISHHDEYLRDSSFFAEFVKWLHDDFSDKDSVVLLERVHDLGYDVEQSYSDKVHSLVSGLATVERLPYLKYAKELFPNSSLIVDDILSCAKDFLKKGDNDKAIATADSILKQSKKACLVKSQALCNKVDSANSAQQKEDLLKQAEAVLLLGCEGEGTSAVQAIINESYIRTADAYYAETNRDKAYDILTSLAQKGIERAAFAIVCHRLSEVQSTATTQEKLNLSTLAIMEIGAFSINTIPHFKDYQLLWDENIAATITHTQSINNAVAVDMLQTLLSSIDAAGFDTSIAKEKKKNVLMELIRRKYLQAKELELSNHLTEAAAIYREINTLEAKRTPTLSALRFIICKLKNNNAEEILEKKDRIYSLLRNAADAFKAEKDDIAYRFSLTLLKSGEDKEALTVLTEFLPSEELLKKACEQGAMIKAQAKLDDFNAKLEAVKNRSLPSNDALYFINHMLEYGDTIKPVLDLPRSTLGNYRNKLKNYAIYKLFDESKYDIAFEKMIKENQGYLDDLTALRNIALICLNMAEAKQISSENFKEVISVWLTAIYQERLFIKSLDYTSWDDQFSFSLYDAYGHFNDDSVGDLPDNVNFDDDNNVVFIKDVQRALLDRFEAAISDEQIYHEFYSSQKDAMDAFIALNLDEKCRLVAPYLAHKDEDLFQDISDALEQDRQQEYDNWEDVLSVGALYRMPQTIYSEYSSAKEYYADCVAVINDNKISKAKQAFASDKIKLINNFNKLNTALLSFANSKASALTVKNKNEFRENYNLYLTICSSLKDSTLSYTFSNYVMQYVVGEVNANSMLKTDASSIILSIYLLDKSNSRVRENLTTLFEMLARENDTKSVDAVNTILSKLRTYDLSLYRSLNKKYEDAKIHKELNFIVDKVNKNTMTMSTALQQVYNMYSNNPNHEGICENLAQLSSICIMKYVVNQESGYNSVQTILDSLKNNISVEFRKHTALFKKQHDEIWNALQQDTKNLLNGRGNPGQTLNDKGCALKRGLQYMRNLGDFTPDEDDIVSLLSRLNRRNNFSF